jgi:hypothetical protein
MSKDIYSEALEKVNRDLIAGSLGLSLKNMLNSAIDNKAKEYNLLKVKPTPEEVREEIEALITKVTEAVIKSREFKDSLYKESYERLRALGDKGNTYGDLLTEIYEDEYHLSEIFVRLVEETEKVAITSAKQLQELTGITEIYLEEKKLTKKEAQEEATKQIEETFIRGMYYRYFSTIENMLETGAKYKDILLIGPKDFNLPERWSGTLGKNKEEVILWGITFTYLINEPGGLMLLPSLRTVAEEIEAPYSVLMKCYNRTNFKK